VRKEEEEVEMASDEECVGIICVRILPVPLDFTIILAVRFFEGIYMGMRGRACVCVF